jgi:hypothetical protein
VRKRKGFGALPMTRFPSRRLDEGAERRDIEHMVMARKHRLPFYRQPRAQGQSTSKERLLGFCMPN